VKSIRNAHSIVSLCPKPLIGHDSVNRDLCTDSLGHDSMNRDLVDGVLGHDSTNRDRHKPRSVTMHRFVTHCRLLLPNRGSSQFAFLVSGLVCASVGGCVFGCDEVLVCPSPLASRAIASRKRSDPGFVFPSVASCSQCCLHQSSGRPHSLEFCSERGCTP
jgi:hypothetical protein